MKLIPLSKTGKHSGKYFAMVDDGDYDYLMGWNWSVLSNNKNRLVYAYRQENNKPVLLHRQIMVASTFQIIDHEDGNGLNCQRHNLRVATHAQNIANRTPCKSKKSTHLGVFWDAKRNKWLAKICSKGKQKNLGRYKLEEDAAKAYKDAALKLHGEFAYHGL